MKLIYLKSALKFDSFDVAIGIKIPFFRVLVTIEPGRSLLLIPNKKHFKKYYIKQLFGRARILAKILN